MSEATCGEEPRMSLRSYGLRCFTPQRPCLREARERVLQRVPGDGFVAPLTTPAARRRYQANPSAPGRRERKGRSKSCSNPGQRHLSSDAPIVSRPLSKRKPPNPRTLSVDQPPVSCRPSKARVSARSVPSLALRAGDARLTRQPAPLSCFPAAMQREALLR